jgi:prophage DNA circulation protein
MSNLENIADILPDGLTESTVEQIFQLVDSTINEQVEKQIGLLEAKVNAFLRTKIDQIKEQALVELAEENQTFRNAQLFESVRALMALELNDGDQQNALSEISDQNQELQEEFDLLTGQLNQVIEENEKLQSTVKVLSGKVSLTESAVDELEGQKAQLLEEVENLVAERDEAFASSEQAVVVSQADREINEERTQNFNNEFLNDEVMRYMPFSQK